jgi:hypothetical protein
MRNIVHGALMLVVNLLAIAGLYLTLESSFLSIIQVLVYAGAIMVLFLFVIMLLGVDRDDLLVVRGLRTKVARRRRRGCPAVRRAAAGIRRALHLERRSAVPDATAHRRAEVRRASVSPSVSATTTRRVWRLPRPSAVHPLHLPVRAGRAAADGRDDRRGHPRPSSGPRTRGRRRRRPDV